MVLSLWTHFKESFAHLFLGLPEGCMAYGSRASKRNIEIWKSCWTKEIIDLTCFLVLAGSKTSEVKGISAAGATASLRRSTPLADAEFLLKGPQKKPKWPLPSLPAGVSPALISYVGKQWLQLNTRVISVGLFQQPDFPHIPMESTCLGPSGCISNGKAMELNRVKDLWRKGFSIGEKVRSPLLITECVPGGTSTAQAVMTGLGFPVEDLMGSSMIKPPFELKKKLVKEGLKAADLGADPLPEQLIAAVGDPFQPVAVGLLLGARKANQQVLLGGGSQMLAVLALALSSLEVHERSDFLQGVAIATTNWLVNEGSYSSLKMQSSFLRLVSLFEKHFRVGILGFSSGLRFHKSKKRVLREYESGYVKEGVGAGSISFLAQLNGASRNYLMTLCEETIDKFSITSNIRIQE